MSINSFEIKKASEYSTTEINIFKKILINEGEVIELTFDRLIKNNPYLLFYPDTNDVKAIGALKIPFEKYKSDVFTKSKSYLKPDDFKFELGWIVVLEQGKGIGNKITKLLSEYKTKIYSTVRKENKVMNHILTKMGFEKVGESFSSKRGDYKINLYTLN